MRVKQIVTLEITYDETEDGRSCQYYDEFKETGLRDQIENCCGARCGIESKPLDEVDWAALLRCCGNVKGPVHSVEVVGPVVKALV